LIFENEPSGKNHDNVWKDEDTYLYLGFLDSESICGLGISSKSLNPSIVLDCRLFKVTDFFDSNFFVFSSDLSCYEPGWHIDKSSVILLRKGGIEIISSRGRATGRTEIDKSSPLWHLLLLSRKMNNRQKDALKLAIQWGFPQVSVVDFTEERIDVARAKILSEWKSVVLNYKDSLEKDFVKTLVSAIKSFEKEYYLLLCKIHSIRTCQDSSDYSLGPLLAILRHTDTEKAVTEHFQPKIGISSLEFEAIFQLEEENIPDFMMDLGEELSSDFLEVSVGEVSRIIEQNLHAPGKMYRVRVFIVLKGVSHSVDLESAAQLVNELRFLVVEKALCDISIIQKAFYKVPFSSYELFINRYKPEFWLKRTGISIIIPRFMMSNAIRVIHRDFGNHLDSSEPISVRKSEHGIEIIFNLHLTSGYDYVIDNSNQSYFSEMRSNDTYVNIGLEHLERKDFDKALKSFRIAKENPKHWIKTTTVLRDINILERDLRINLLTQEEHKKKIRERRNLRCKREFRIRKKYSRNFFNFLEDIGGFYVEFLQEIKEHFPNLVEDWINLRI
jgi:hypothetical protein